MPLIPVLGGQPGVHSQFQASQGYIVRPSLKQTKKEQINTGFCNIAEMGLALVGLTASTRSTGVHNITLAKMYLFPPLCYRG